MMSAQKIRKKMAAIAAKELGVVPESLTFQNGKIFQKGNEKNSLQFDAVAAMGYNATKSA